MVGVDLGCFQHEPHALLAVFLNVLLGAGVYEVDLEVGEGVGFGVVDGAAAGQVPVIDVVGAEVLERAEGAGN